MTIPMNRKGLLLLSLFFCFLFVHAQETQKSELQQRAETEEQKGSIGNARSLFIKAFNEYATNGQVRQGVECGVKATSLYYKENLYKEAFEFLHRVEAAISSSKESAATKADVHQTEEERQGQGADEQHGSTGETC